MRGFKFKTFYIKRSYDYYQVMLAITNDYLYNFSNKLSIKINKL